MSIFETIFERLSALEQRFANIGVEGKVTDVDPSKRVYRQVIGKDENGNDVKSPWIPYSQHAGAFKAHIPPTVGQSMMLISNGDMETGVGIPATWSDSNPSPSDKGDQNVITFGPYTATLKGDELRIKGPKIVLELGGNAIELTEAAFKIPEGMRVDHAGKNIGKDHTHGGITPGGYDTDVPNA